MLRYVRLRAGAAPSTSVTIRGKRPWLHPPLPAVRINNNLLIWSSALVVNQMDALEIHDFFVFSRSVGILLTASPDLTEPAHGEREAT